MEKYLVIAGWGKATEDCWVFVVAPIPRFMIALPLEGPPSPAIPTQAAGERLSPPSAPGSITHPAHFKPQAACLILEQRK